MFVTDAPETPENLGMVNLHPARTLNDGFHDDRGSGRKLGRELGFDDVPVFQGFVPGGIVWARDLLKGA